MGLHTYPLSGCVVGSSIEHRNVLIFVLWDSYYVDMFVNATIFMTSMLLLAILYHDQLNLISTILISSI